jgi:hypothetical protein
VAAYPEQAVGRHERRPHQASHPGRAARAGMTLVPPAPAPRAGRADGTRMARSWAARTRGTRARHAARGGLGLWMERAGRAAEQARGWWAEGTDRVTARARERWSQQASQRGARRHPATAGGPGAHPRASTATRTRPAASPRHLAAETRRTAWREDLVTGWGSVLLVLGLYLDGWSFGGRPGGAVTLWHGVLYLGFALTAGWILTRNQRRGAWSLPAVPAGYRLALVGVGLAMVAVAGDTVWHTLFGASHGLGRLVSPFHLVLFTGACLLVSSALRAAWSGPGPARVPGLRAFWPVVLSTTLVVAMTAFFFQHTSPMAAAALPAGEAAQVYQLLGLLAHNLLFIAPVLLLLQRWQTPLGTFTVMAGSAALLLATQTGLGLVGLAGAAVLGGAAADVAVTVLRPSPQRPWAARTVAVVAPAVYWTSHFALLGAGYGARRDLEIWLGSVVWACLSGLTLALLMWPPAVPLTAWNRGRAAARRSATPTPMPARMVGR